MTDQCSLGDNQRAKYETYKKRIFEYDEDCQIMSRLDCKTTNEAGVKVMTNLKCRMYCKHEDKIIEGNSFSESGVLGLTQ